MRHCNLSLYREFFCRINREIMYTFKDRVGVCHDVSKAYILALGLEAYIKQNDPKHTANNDDIRVKGLHHDPQ